jgi:hypothetical protein
MLPTTIYAEPSDLEMVRRIATCLRTEIKNRVSVAPTAQRNGELRVALADVRYTQKGRSHVSRGKLIVRRGEVTRTLLVKGELRSGRKLTAEDRADLVADAAARLLAGFLAPPKKRTKAVAVEAFDPDDDLFAARFVATLRDRGYVPTLVDDLDTHRRAWGRLRLGAARIDLARRSARLSATRAGFGERYFETTLRTTLPTNATEEAAYAKLANKLLAWFENAAGVM